MLRIPGRFWALAAALLVLNLGGWIWLHYSLTRLPQQRIRVLNVTPTGRADGADRFTLLFDDAVAPADRVGREVSSALFEVSPRPKGTWRWAAADRLEFLLEEPLPAGRVYRIEPVADLEARSGRKLVGPGRFEVRTAPLELQRVHRTSADRDHVTLEMTFNQPVSPEALKERMSVVGERSGQEDEVAEHQVLTREVDDRMVVRVDRRGHWRRLKLFIDRGLSGARGELPLGADVRETVELPGRFTVTNHYAGDIRLGVKPELNIFFSQQVGTRQDLSGIRVEPRVEDLSIHRYGTNMELRGDFQPSTTYKVHLPATLISQDDQPLGRERTIAITTGRYRPQIRFEDRTGILSPAGNLQAPLQLVNVTNPRVTVRRLYANNLVPRLKNLPLSSTSRTIVSGKRLEVETEPDTPVDALLDVGQLVSNRPGMYSINVRAERPHWTSDTLTTVLTDLALTAKKQPGGFLVWVTSIAEGAGQAGIHVEARSGTNQVLAEATTDADGLAELRFSDSHPDGPAFVLIASRGDELSFLVPDKRQWMLEGVDTTGRSPAGSYDVMLYGERGVYRPGDVIHVTGIARGLDGGVPDSLPLEIRVTRPDGREVNTFSVRTDAAKQGVFHIEYPTVSTCRTGPWRFTARLAGSPKALGSTHVHVEAFRPVRMEVQAEPEAAYLGPDHEGPVAVDVSARYLWGRPVAQRPIRLVARYQAVDFQSDKYSRYTFGAGASVNKAVAPVTDVLDDQGTATLAAPIPDDLPGGLYRATLRYEVTEVGGRTVSAVAETMVDLLGLHVGLRLEGDRSHVPVDEPFTVQWVRLDGEARAADPGEMTAVLERIGWDSYVEIVDGRRVWRSRQTTETVQTRKIDAEATTEARGQVSFRCSRYGRYRLRLRDEETGSTTRIEFWAGYGEGQTPVAMNQPERISISTDRETYEAGQTVSLVLQSPITGTALVALESDRVLWRKVIRLEKNTTDLAVKLPEDLRGGAFVTATVVRPLDREADKWLPPRALGAARIELTYPSKELSVAIEAPRQARPAQTVEATVRVSDAAGPADGAAVHVWAVDEGICLVTDYAVPAPGEHFLAHRRLGVAGSDVFYDLLPDFARPADMTRIGAGDGALASLRRSPVPTPYEHPAVVWREVVTVDENGEATLELPMPKLNTEMRIMAVATRGDQYGSTRRAVTLTTPLMVEASWPRFAAPGDVFDVPVRLINTTDLPAVAALELDLGPLATIEPAEPIDRLELAPGATRIVWLRVRAESLGVLDGRMTLRPIGGDDEAPAGFEPASTWVAMPIRPGSPLHGETRLERIEAGESLEIRAGDALEEGTCITRVRVSSRPDVHLLPALRKLLDYPHGCVEQTTSGLLPLIYAPDLLGQAGGDDEQYRRISEMVRGGIARLWSMQTADGGLAYWPGGTTSSPWGTAYAAGVLAEAARAGYKVDEQFIDPLAGYLRRRLESSNRAGESLNTKALICRVLATLDEADPGWLALLAEQADKLDIAGRADLAAAYLASGRRDKALELMDADLLTAEVPLSMEGRLTSQTTQEARLLSVLLELEPKHAWIGVLMRRLDEARRGSGAWGSTINNASVIAALSKAVVLQDGPVSFRGRIQAGEKTVEFTEASPAGGTFEDASVRVTTQGEGQLYVTVMREGLARPGVVEPYDRGLVVRREWLDAQGEPIDPARLQVGDRVEVRIHLRSRGGRQVPNVAIVDALPACVEVEAPWLTRLDENGQGAPDRTEFLDDRVVLFATAGQEKVFRYHLRVTTAGSFLLPGLQGSAMYNPEVASLTEATRLEVAR